MDNTKQWVVGFLFRNDGAEVALMKKTHPAWQAGKFNGMGGSIEEGETPLDAVRREFMEEAGVAIDDWRQYAQLDIEGMGTVYFFAAQGDYAIKTMTEEEVGWYPLDDLRRIPLIDNLRWLIPLGLDDRARAVIEYH